MSSKQRQRGKKWTVTERQEVLTEACLLPIDKYWSHRELMLIVLDPFTLTDRTQMLVGFFVPV